MTDYLIDFAKKYAANYRGLPILCWQGIILMGINTLTIGICFSYHYILLIVGTLPHLSLGYCSLAMD